jgi:hypothetical protein
MSERRSRPSQRPLAKGLDTGSVLEHVVRGPGDAEVVAARPASIGRLPVPYRELADQVGEAAVVEVAPPTRPRPHARYEALALVADPGQVIVLTQPTQPLNHSGSSPLGATAPPHEPRPSAHEHDLKPGRKDRYGLRYPSDQKARRRFRTLSMAMRTASGDLLPSTQGVRPQPHAVRRAAASVRTVRADDPTQYRPNLNANGLAAVPGVDVQDAACVGSSEPLADRVGLHP